MRKVSTVYGYRARPVFYAADALCKGYALIPLNPFTGGNSIAEGKMPEIFVRSNSGEGEINELAVFIISHPVKNWSPAGEPTSYGNPIVDWQSDYPYSIVGGGDSKITFECSNCMAQFEHPKRSE
jgi:hypothetical protein